MIYHPDVRDLGSCINEDHNDVSILLRSSLLVGLIREVCSYLCNAYSLGEILRPKYGKSPRCVGGFVH